MEFFDDYRLKQILCLAQCKIKSYFSCGFSNGCKKPLFTASKDIVPTSCLFMISYQAAWE